jgi:hypothetical protein
MAANPRSAVYKKFATSPAFLNKAGSKSLKPTTIVPPRAGRCTSALIAQQTEHTPDLSWQVSSDLFSQGTIPDSWETQTVGMEEYEEQTRRRMQEMIQVASSSTAVNDQELAGSPGQGDGQSQEQEAEEEVEEEEDEEDEEAASAVLASTGESTCTLGRWSDGHTEVTRLPPSDVQHQPRHSLSISQRNQLEVDRIEALRDQDDEEYQNSQTQQSEMPPRQYKTRVYHKKLQDIGFVQESPPFSGNVPSGQHPDEAPSDLTDASDILDSLRDDLAEIAPGDASDMDVTSDNNSTKTNAITPPSAPRKRRTDHGASGSSSNKKAKQQIERKTCKAWRFDKLRDERSRQTRLAHIDEIQGNWGCPIHDVVPDSICPRSYNSKPSIPRDWNEDTLEAMVRLSLQTIGRPKLATDALERAVEKQAREKGGKRWILHKDDVEVAIVMLGARSSTGPRESSHEFMTENTGRLTINDDGAVGSTTDSEDDNDGLAGLLQSAAEQHVDAGTAPVADQSAAATTTSFSRDEALKLKWKEIQIQKQELQLQREEIALQRELWERGIDPATL